MHGFNSTNKTQISQHKVDYVDIKMLVLLLNIFQINKIRARTSPLPTY